MATLESIKNKLQNLIDVSNEVTEEASEDLTSAVNLLIDGYMSGVNSEFLRYVTFMESDYETVSETVSVEPKYSYPASSAPRQVKDSTIDTVYTHVGWSLVPDGDINTSVFADIKRDITLYPVFNESVRHYTVRFYNGDELVCTESVPYGGSSSYVHEIVGAWFLGWNPAPVNITGDMDCYGMWEYTAFATASWARIAEIAKAGRASEYYSIGDEREIIFTTGERVTLQLASFNKYGDGNGITIVAKNALANSKMAFNTVPHSSDKNTYNHRGYEGSDVYTYLHEQILPVLPVDLQDVIYNSPIPNVYYPYPYNTPRESTVYCKLFVPSAYEACGLDSNRPSGSKQFIFEVFINEYDKLGLPIHNDLANELRIRTLRDTGEIVPWWTRTPSSRTNMMYTVIDTGVINTMTYWTQNPDAYVVFAFCL